MNIVPFIFLLYRRNVQNTNYNLKFVKISFYGFTHHHKTKQDNVYIIFITSIYSESRFYINFSLGRLHEILVMFTYSCEYISSIFQLSYHDTFKRHSRELHRFDDYLYLSFITFFPFSFYGGKRFVVIVVVE